MKVVILGNPENRRVAFFQEALARAGQPPARVLSWLDLLAGRARLEDEVDPRTLLRIESPGESFAVERALIARGADEPDADETRTTAARIDRARALALEPDHGRILFPRQWYLGFRAVLRTLRAPAFLNAPPEIERAFDKRATQDVLARAGVPIPAPVPRARSWEELRAILHDSGRSRCFVKLASGSSASGVVALATTRERVRAWTTVELGTSGGETRLYNSLRVRTYTDERTIATIVDAILREGAQLEEWVPKAGVDDRSLDLRIVVIGDRPRHVVVRTSKGPLTNLHLGNRRGDVALVREALGSAVWERAREAAVAARRAFPGLLYAGIDVAIAANKTRVAVLEVNAFGDLLPNVVDAGQDTYSAELEAALALVPA